MKKTIFYYNKKLLITNAAVLFSGLAAFTALCSIFYFKTAQSFFIIYILVIYGIFLPSFLGTFRILFKYNCEFIIIDGSNVVINSVGFSKRKFALSEIKEVISSNSKIRISYQKNKLFKIRESMLSSNDEFIKLSRLLTQWKTGKNS